MYCRWRNIINECEKRISEENDHDETKGARLIELIKKYRLILHLMVLYTIAITVYWPFVHLTDYYKQEGNFRSVIMFTLTWTHRLASFTIMWLFVREVT